jgi:uncharacterized protein YdeI (YjbR/CyaY-like superfamily)
MQVSPKNPAVDAYLAEGCGRCSLYATPDCKVHAWARELEQLRRILLACGLTEEVKWKVPCYTSQGRNIVLLTAFKDYACLSFFKGALLRDEAGLLQAPGEHSQAVRLMPFTRVADILETEGIIRAYVTEAVSIEKAGRKVVFKKIGQHRLPDELKALFEARPDVKEAFEALTPGRRRSHMLYVSGAKRAETREKRARQCAEKILEGRGWLER